jgi:Peptidase A4 family
MHMIATGRMRRAWTALIVGAGLTTGFGALALVGPAAVSSTVPGPILLHPNHPLGAKGGHGHGGGGSSVGWASSNWSGYAITGSTYTAVTGNWTVPSVAPSNTVTYSAAWAGIDGFNNNSLIQTGTEQDNLFGIPRYGAWWTTSAQGFAEQTITTGCTGSGSCGRVVPGDRMTASINGSIGGAWTITLSDSTQSWSFTEGPIAYSGPGTSAEWIMEAPSGLGGVLPLAHYSSPMTFDPGTVNNNANPTLVASNGGEMIQGRQVVSIPSGPDTDTDGFNMAYGSTAPGAPGT